MSDSIRAQVKHYENILIERIIFIILFCIILFHYLLCSSVEYINQEYQHLENMFRKFLLWN